LSRVKATHPYLNLETMDTKILISVISMFSLIFAAPEARDLNHGVDTSLRYTLPELDYAYDALEPVISAEIMELHHSKHHAGYVRKLNAAQEKLEEALANGDLAAAVKLLAAIKFNGGGHINHSIFWKNMIPGGSGEPTGELADLINRDFGSFDHMKANLSASTTAVQGSGWGWLGYKKEAKRLEVATCMNQDPLEATTGLVPLFGIDVWEHAYYLQYKNARKDYVTAIYDVANWNDVSDRLEAAMK